MEKEIIICNCENLALNFRAISMQSDQTYRGIHSHQAVEIIKIHSGKISFYTGEKWIELDSGTNIFVNSGRPHCIKPIEKSKITYIQFYLSEYYTYRSQDDLRYIDEYISYKKSKPYFIFPSYSEASETLERVFSELMQKNDGYEMYTQGGILQIIAYLRRNGVLSQEKSDVKCKMLTLLPIIQYIDENYSNPMNIDELSSLIFYTRYSLCRLFKNVTGGTVVDYINFVRLQKATEMMINSSSSILEIALNCGFNSVQYFNKTFKKHFGCTPNKYRIVKIKQ